MRKGHGGYRRLEQLAQQLPTLVNVIDEQPLGWNSAGDLALVTLEYLKRIVAFVEFAVEGILPDRAVDRLQIAFADPVPATA